MRSLSLYTMFFVMTSMMWKADSDVNTSAVMTLMHEQTCFIAVAIVPHTQLKRFRIFEMDTVQVQHQPEWIQASLLPLDSTKVWLRINQNEFRDALKLNRNHPLKSIKLDRSFEIALAILQHFQLDTCASPWMIPHTKKLTFDETYLYLKIEKIKI